MVTLGPSGPGAWGRRRLCQVGNLVLANIYKTICFFEQQDDSYGLDDCWVNKFHKVQLVSATVVVNLIKANYFDNHPISLSSFFNS